MKLKLEDISALAELLVKTAKDTDIFTSQKVKKEAIDELLKDGKSAILEAFKDVKDAFEEVLDEVSAKTPTSANGTKGDAQSTKKEFAITSTDDVTTIVVSVPGYTKEDISLKLENKILSISSEGAKYFKEYIEWNSKYDPKAQSNINTGAFKLTISVSRPVESINYDIMDGLLYVSISYKDEKPEDIIKYVGK